VGVTIKEEDVVLQRIHVMKEKGIVMDQEMVEVMMVMQDVKMILCVEATIARNLGHFIMKWMTAVRAGWQHKPRDHQPCSILAHC
jgi:hypothetical protein